jgi:long-chain acyl-CoA synthetase
LYDGLSALAAGGTVIRSADRSAAAVIDTMQLFRPDFMAMAPSLLHEIVQRLETNPALFPKVETIRTSGAYCSPQLQRDALARICDDIVMTYGSVETGFLAWGHSRDLRKVDRSVGQLLVDVEVAAFDSNGRKLPAGSEGVIWAKVPDEAIGRYLGSAAHKSDAIREGWFRTGDIGLVDNDRNLIIRGRATNVINIGGSKVSPEVLEVHIQTMPGVVEVGVTGVDLPEGFQRVCAAIVGAANPSSAAVNAHLERRREPRRVHAVKHVEAIPRTDTGKIDRVALKRLCAE